MTVYTDPLGSLRYEGKSAKIPPACPICGAREVWDVGSQRFENIKHNYAAHNLDRPSSPRMESEELFGSVDSTTLDKLGGRREA